MKKKKIVIVGAGPGGLTAAMLLADKNYDVEVFEKDDRVGGRNQELRLGEYRFDTGPTFLMMKFILDEVFQETGKNVDDYLDFVKLEPMYTLDMVDKRIDIHSDKKKMKAEIKRVFPGQEDGLDKFMKKEEKRYRKLFPCLQKDYSNHLSYFKPRFLRAIPAFQMLPPRSLFEVMGDYFGPEELRLSFTFQSKYLGMSPWDCPGAFGMIPFVEHKYGIYHVTGGLSEISGAMAKAAKEDGARIHLKTPVKKLITKGKNVLGIELEDGRKVKADAVIVNEDFAFAMNQLVEKGTLKKYAPEKLLEKKYSCSIFMIYLGLSKLYDTPHHEIFFAKEYKKNLKEIFDDKVISKDTSFYIRNASITDETLAPPGKSAIYVLVPVPNNKSGIDWEKEKEDFKNNVYDQMEARSKMKDFRKYIEKEHVITPDDWEKDYHVYKGAVFNLAHSLNQMLSLRPRNKFEELENLYLVGGGTHPGSGLPTIYESARISSELITRKY